MALQSAHVTEVDDNPPQDEEPLSAEDEAGTGKMSVQMLRTYPCGYKMLDGSSVKEVFAPRGEQSYGQAIIKAISLASHHIYIEDQYALWHTEVFAELSKALERGL